MTAEAGIIVGVVVALVLLVVARRWDRRQHQDKLDRIQERIRRREENSEQQKKGV